MAWAGRTSPKRGTMAGARPAPRWRSWLVAPLFFVIAYALVICFLLVNPAALDPLERD